VKSTGTKFFSDLFVFCRELFLHHSAFLQRKVGKTETGWKESRFITVLFDALLAGYLVYRFLFEATRIMLEICHSQQFVIPVFNCPLTSLQTYRNFDQLFVKFVL
jgi:hydrogenase-4 membrane subunit HyfE